IAAEAERRLVCQPDARPPMVVVERRNGDTLGVVFARNGSMLHFISASCDPPYFTSVGDPTAEGLFAFEYEGHYSEAPMRHLIDAAVARAVIHSFVVADEGLPAQLNWETD
ncbi:MAG TPA: Imm1 family immunity protein, partial [Planctomycetaceae bacterium]